MCTECHLVHNPVLLMWWGTWYLYGHGLSYHLWEKLSWWTPGTLQHSQSLNFRLKKLMYFMQQETKSREQVGNNSWACPKIGCFVCQPVHLVSIGHTTTGCKKNSELCNGLLFSLPLLYPPCVQLHINCIYIDMYLYMCKNANRVCTRGTEYKWQENTLTAPSPLPWGFFSLCSKL